VALGDRRAGAVACYSWSLLVPRRLGDCVSMKHAKRIVRCSGVGFVRSYQAHPYRRKAKSITSKIEACVGV
jgi:hypothetical protein